MDPNVPAPLHASALQFSVGLTLECQPPQPCSGKEEVTVILPGATLIIVAVNPQAIPPTPVDLRSILMTKEDDFSQRGASAVLQSFDPGCVLTCGMQFCHQIVVWVLSLSTLASTVFV